MKKKKAYELGFEDNVFQLSRAERWNTILIEGILGVMYRVAVKAHGGIVMEDWAVLWGWSTEHM